MHDQTVFASQEVNEELHENVEHIGFIAYKCLRSVYASLTCL